MKPVIRFNELTGQYTITRRGRKARPITPSEAQAHFEATGSCDWTQGAYKAMGGRIVAPEEIKVALNYADHGVAGNRIYTVRPFPSMKAANAFMEENRDYGCVCELKDGTVLLAKLDHFGEEEA